jgi:hypothetical protein
MTRVLNMRDDVLICLPGGVIERIHLRRVVVDSPNFRDAVERVYLTTWVARWLQDNARHRAKAMRRNRELSRHRRNAKASARGAA